MRDLVVAGGGPVGLATALYAARAGLDVAVHEPRSGAIDKACGEGLMPGAVARLDSLGVATRGRSITGIRYLTGSRSAEAPFGHGAGRGVRRTALHAALREAVEAAGVEVVAEPVRSVTQDTERVLVDGRPVRHLVAADGLHSPVRRLLGMEGRARGPRRFGQRVHGEIEPWTSYVEVHWAPVGEAYVTPVGERQVGIAVLTRERRSLPELLEAFPELRARLEGVTLSKVRGAGPLRQRVRRRVTGRVLLVGDAAGYIDALTGEGIALGLAQAEAAVGAVCAGAPERYEAASRRLGRRHDLLTLGLVTATRAPAVRRLIVPAAARLPRIFASTVDQLARPA